MKSIKQLLQFSTLLLLLPILVSCYEKEQDTDKALISQPEITGKKEQAVTSKKDAPLPVHYQKPSYMVDMPTREDLDLSTDDVALKVGATIRSTVGAQPLGAIMKQLAGLKDMSVSWASDVNQNVLVDVNISANDDFFMAINNLLRQVDYFQEIQGSTIVVKYKETKQYHIAMPFTKHTYETGTGGNMLGSEDTAANIEGTIRLDSKGNEFDIWKNVEDNLNTILNVWTTEAVTTAGTSNNQEDVSNNSGSESGSNQTMSEATRRRSGNTNVYLIDKPVGIITVTAPRPIQEKISAYFDNLKKELYKQINIEAKIIEVRLTDFSSIGLNWNLILENLSFGASLQFDRNRSDTTSDTKTTTKTSGTTYGKERHRVYDYLLDDSKTADTGTVDSTVSSTVSSTATASLAIVDTITQSIGGTIGLATFNFDQFIHVLEEQGETTVLSNPKISVLNGQPALISVGRNVTYIDAVESNVSEAGVVTYSFNTERVMSGVGMSLTANIFKDDKVIMNLVPIISQLEEPIEYRTIGLGQVGLPVINVREMSTTVTVNDGEMLVIGGLINTTNDKEGSFMPLLGKIPLIRYLFGYEEKTKTKRELIILLRPKII